MKLAEIFTALLIMSGVIIGMGTAVSSLGANYGKTDTFAYSTFDQTSEVQKQADKLNSQLSLNQTNFDPLKAFDILNFMFYGLSALFLTIPNMIHDITYLISLQLGFLIPDWLLGLTVVIALITIALKVAGIVFRREV